MIDDVELRCEPLTLTVSVVVTGVEVVVAVIAVVVEAIATGVLGPEPPEPVFGDECRNRRCR